MSNYIISETDKLYNIGDGQEDIFCLDYKNTGQSQQHCFTIEPIRQQRQRGQQQGQGQQQRQQQFLKKYQKYYEYNLTVLSVLLSVLFLFFLVYTLRLYYYNIEDLSEEDFEQRQKNISTMIQINIGLIILVIGLYFMFK
jgi:hypothetical protein